MSTIYTGFMLRSNPASDSNPGSVRFVVKVEPHSRVKGQSPIRTSYLTIDIGSEWQQPTGLCPSGAIKVGYLSNGKPSCINPTKKCAAGTVHLGLDASANPICKTPPASCATSGGSVVINAEGNDLVCATNMNEIPCQASEIFLGYYAGTGVPMCSGTNLSCAEGEVQIGIRQEGAALQAQCKKLPSCQDSQKLSYDGSQFVCQSAQVASSCAENEVVVGVNSDGSVKCSVQNRNIASSQNNTSPNTQVYYLVKNDYQAINSTSEVEISGLSQSITLTQDTVVTITAKIHDLSHMAPTGTGGWAHYFNLKNNSTYLDRSAFDVISGYSISTNIILQWSGVLSAGVHNIKVTARVENPLDVIRINATEATGSVADPNVKSNILITATAETRATASMGDLRPLMVKNITPTSAAMVNGAIANSLMRMYNGNMSLVQPIATACQIADTGLSVVGSKSYFGELSYCLLHVCSGINGEYPAMAQLRGGCGSLNTDPYCNGQFSMSISCMY